MDRKTFLQDEKTRSAVERELLTVSEACHRMGQLEEQHKVPKKQRLATRFPQIPWAQIASIGNILRHDYGRVDPEIVWATISGDDLDQLKGALLQAFPAARER